MEQVNAAAVAEATQYLTFKLEEEVFALGISKVREVLDYTTITRIPEMPEFMLGVINLRGSVVPVVDMRLKFGMSRSEAKVNTCIIIVEIDLDGETTIIGALADSVQEVLELDPDQVEAPPRIGTRLKSRFIKGMGKRDNQFIIILDIDEVFSADELAMTHEAGSEIEMAS
jgi:purine-binding chemotaxis protein CheW